MELEETDISALLASGWVEPIPFSTKARDQQTDLFGLMYRPSNFDASVRYPVLNYLYPGPQSGSVGSRSFRASRNDKQAIAELGFIIVEVDAMGTPGRSKSFHDAYYGNMGDNGLPDQITAIRQLAERYPWLDLDRVGIWGHSGGGFASTAGILRYPEFYKVAVSSAGNHDNRKNFLDVFPYYQPDHNGFLQSSEAYEHFDFIFLDTLKDPHDDIPKSCGYLCKKCLDWLSQKLNVADHKKVILFMQAKLKVQCLIRDQVIFFREQISFWKALIMERLLIEQVIIPLTVYQMVIIRSWSLTLVTVIIRIQFLLVLMPSLIMPR